MCIRDRPNSILILDRFFTSFFLQVELRTHNIDYVIRARDDFAKRILGRKSDVILNLDKPERSSYNYGGCYDEIPNEIKVRVVKSSIKRDGYRSAHLYIITSLIDDKKYLKKDIEKKACKWHWKNKNIYIADGTILSMEDTSQNRDEYPLSYAKGKQLGQPKLRLLGLFGLSSGALVDAELGKYIGLSLIHI